MTDNGYIVDDDGIDSIESSEVVCETTAGSFSMTFRKSWSPNGYDRAVELFDRGYYDGSHFFRVVPGFLTQFGMSYTEDKELSKFADSTIVDDPQLDPRIPFREGVISFAGHGKNSRTSHLFISYGSSGSLGTELWESPVGYVSSGMETIRNLNHDYGDMPPWGHGPEQHKIREGGRTYVEENFPALDKFLECKVNINTLNEELGGEVSANEELEDIEEVNVIDPVREDTQELGLVDTGGLRLGAKRIATYAQDKRTNFHEHHENGSTIERVVILSMAVFALLFLSRSKKKRKNS